MIPRQGFRPTPTPQALQGSPLIIAADGNSVTVDIPGASRIVLQHHPVAPDVRAPAVPVTAMPTTLGRINSSLARVIAAVADDFPTPWSPGGTRPVPRMSWSVDDVARFIRQGTVPRGAPNELDFMKTLFARLAQHLGDPADPGLKRFLVQLDAARSGAELAGLVTYHFVAPGGGDVRFLPPPYAPAPGVDLVRLPHYESMRQAAGLNPQVFERLCGELSPRAPFLAKVFTDPAHKPWGEAFFSQAGRQLAQCKPGEAAAVVLYHRDCYGVKRDGKDAEIVGKGITHISVMALTPQGDVCVNHQESITFGGGARRNLMTGSLGLVCGSYDTRRTHERVAAALGGKPPVELPVDQSFRLHGGPAGMVTRLGSYERFREHTEGLETRGASAEGLSLYYAADPDHVIRRLAGEDQTGTMDNKSLAQALDSKTRLRAQPDVRALDAEPGQGHLDYSNNCTLTTLLTLKAGGCVALDKPERISSSNTLQGLQQVLLDSRLMPYTDPALPQRAQAAWKDGDDINTKSFLIAGSGQATQLGMGLRADIPYGEEFRRSRL